MFLSRLASTVSEYTRKITPSKSAPIPRNRPKFPKRDFTNNSPRSEMVLPGTKNWKHTTRPTINGRSGFSFSFSKRDWHTEKNSRSTGVLAVKPCWRTSRSYKRDKRQETRNSDGGLRKMRYESN